MPDDSPINLPINCRKCGQAVTVIYTPSADYTVQHWRCPYDGCHVVNQVMLGGTGLSAVARYLPELG